MQQHQDFYEVRIKDHLDAKWSEWFEGLEVVNMCDDSGETVLRGQVADQAALHGILARIRDLNLTLVSIHRIDGDRDLLHLSTKES